MARLNIDDTLWSDTRFLKLAIALQDELRAVGAIVVAWKLAEQHWVPNKKSIPIEVFENSKLPMDLISCGLAEMREDGVYMKGSDEHFAWRFEKIEAAKEGGRRSVAARKKKYGTAIPQNASNKNRTTAEPKPNQTEPSYSSSSSSSSSSSESNTCSKKENINSPDPNGSAQVIPKRQKTKIDFTSQIETLYQEFYPRKEGKTRGMKRLKPQIQSQEDLERLKQAMQNYAAKTLGTDRQYIMHFATFAGEWMDWLDPATGSKASQNQVLRYY